MELLKLLIADDEENIRNGLKCILDWEDIGYKFCGEASNGKDTVNQIINLKPDLVILDIKMPGMTGIEVISQVNDYYSKHNETLPAFIILSGFSEFEYAQKTINLGAKAFLLKPVDEDELKEKAEKIGQEIRDKKRIEATYKNAEALEIKNALIRLIQKEKVDLSDFYYTSFFENAENSMYQTVIFYPKYLTECNTEAIEASLSNNLSFFKYEIIKNEDKIIVFLKTQNSQAVLNSIERVAKYNNSKTCFSIGSPYKGTEGILKSYEEAIDYEKYIFFFPKDSFICASKIQNCNSNIEKEQIELILQNCIFCIETYDKNKLEVCFSRINQMLFGVNNSEEIIKKQFVYILVELQNRLKNKYPERDFYDEENFDFVQTVLEMKTYEEIFNYMKNTVNKYLESFNFNTVDSVIVKVLAYIKNNYQEDLKLETLGDMFNCNSAYLGKKFKKYTGVQFNSYLDNLRIEEAKDKLLNSNLKIYQISKLVGYSNTDYFFMKFKKNTGVTPKEYKKMIEEKGLETQSE